MGPGWYLRRLSRMGPAEITGRVVAAVRIRRGRSVPNQPAPTPLPDRTFRVGPPDGLSAAVPAAARQRLVASAERLMSGEWEFFGVTRTDMVAPDWHLDPRTGRHAPGDEYAFDTAYRDERVVGDIKQLWELSRHHHLTVLAAAYAVTGEDRYACRVADHLKSWWAANPPLRGVHWVSGIELGIRLLSWVWTRRLLEGWSGAPGLFEQNEEALLQIHSHQRWLATFPSIGSSANNHVIAEAAGQLAAACAFPWFPESDQWRRKATRLLDEQLNRNTFASGLNRELATEYHGLVLELGLAAAAETEAAGHPAPESTWTVLLRMCDALAAVLDSELHPPRQGDADDGFGLIVDGEGTHRWASLLRTGEALFGRLDWWPATEPDDVRTPLLTAVAGPGANRPSSTPRPADRPAHFADAGLTILRAPIDRADTAPGQLWCRCDGGPHGFLSIAAHAHADALSLEVRIDGVDVLADPGTYCYHGQPRWRAYFRSTLGHNTLELDGADQSRSGGPFMWVRHARTRVLVAHGDPAGVSRWSAEHDGYTGRGGAGGHRRSVELDREAGTLTVVDEVHTERARPCRLAFHLGPTIEVRLTGATAALRWPAGAQTREATLDLPDGLEWSAHRGEEDPPLGWYSPGFGRREPSWTLVGRGQAGGPVGRLCSVLLYHERSPGENRSS